MLQKYLYADEYQHHAAGDLRLFLVARAEAVAHQDADQGEDERSQADGERRGQNVHAQKGEGDAHGQSVDAGGNGHQQKRF